jgi:hypothetical protein
MKVGDLVKWSMAPFLSKEEKYGLLIQIDYERSYPKHIVTVDKREYSHYSHQVLIGEKVMWFKPSELEVIETV